MKFSKWLKKRIVETLNPELNNLKRQEQQILMSMEMRKDPNGAIYGINKAGYVDAANKLKEVRAKIKELESSAVPSSGEVKPVPAWIQSQKTV
jgi:predicted translin family RNA/ssDNA-binding protein